MTETWDDRVVEKCRENLKRGRAVATGIGIFFRIHDGSKQLMRIRTERGSPIDNRDYSGKLELIGGGVEVKDFDTDYQSAIISTARREMMEEAGLELVNLPDIKLTPAWALIAKSNAIDLAFVMDVPFSSVKTTQLYDRLIEEKNLRWFSFQELQDLKEEDFISRRMTYLVRKSVLNS